MKTCQYCGRENAEEATQCTGCGEPLALGASAEQPRAPWKRVAVLDGEVEAERLGVELKRLEVPHVLVSYADSALDGLFQTSKGWGHIEAPEEFQETVASCLNDLRRASREEPPPEPDQS